MRFAYDYQNIYTKGWVRSEFEGAFPLDVEAAGGMLSEAAKSWPNGTALRLVRIDVNGTETFPEVTAQGSRGAMPRDKDN